MVNIPGAPGYYEAFGRTEIDNGDGTYTLRVSDAGGGISSVSLAYPVPVVVTGSESVSVTNFPAVQTVAVQGLTSASITSLPPITAAISGTQSNSLAFPVTLTQPQTVTATNLGTRPLTSASDSVTAHQGGNWNVGVPSLTSTSIAYPVTTTGTSTVSGTVTVGNIVPVSSTNLGTRPLTSSSDFVSAVQSGAWNVNVLEDSGISANSIAYPVTPTGGTIGQIIGDVRATNLGIRPLRSDSDTITVTNITGDIHGTNLGIRPLRSDSDTVTVANIIGDVHSTNLGIRPLRSDSDTITVANVIGDIKATNLGIRSLNSNSDFVNAVQSGTWTIPSASVVIVGKTNTFIESNSIAYPVTVGNIVPVSATNLGIRPLNSASDVVSAAQNGTWNIGTLQGMSEDVTGTNFGIRPLRSDSDTITVANVIGDVKGTNFGIRPLTSASDTVGAAQSGTWNINTLVGMSEDVTGTNFGIRPLRSDSDTVTVANVIGDIKGTNFGIRPLTSASDTVGAVQSGTWNLGAVSSASMTVTPMNTISTTSYAKNLVIKPAAGVLYGLTGYNSKATAQFIQLHDAASLPSDGAVPEVTFTVPGVSNFSLDYGVRGKTFGTGIVVCNSSTGPTKTIGSASDCWFDAQLS